jgi:hypothetical protein
MKLVNLTPHTIKVVVSDGYMDVLEIPPSGKVARVSAKQYFYDYVEVYKPDPFGEGPEEFREVIPLRIPVSKTVYGEVEGVPEPKEGMVYIVSSLVKQQLPDRDDVVAPDTGPSAIRENGQVVAVTRFQI